jgi:hypothetical protein
MKGTLHKTNRGWVVKQVIKEGPQARLVNQYPLVDNGYIIDKHRQITSFNCEGLEVDFEIVVNEGEPLGKGEQPYKQYAKLTPFISDNFQTKPGFVEKRMNQMLEHLANEEFKNVGDEGLFPNHTDKDIWIAGFKAGYLKK